MRCSHETTNVMNADTVIACYKMAGSLADARRTYTANMKQATLCCRIPKGSASHTVGLPNLQLTIHKSPQLHIISRCHSMFLHERTYLML